MPIEKRECKVPRQGPARCGTLSSESFGVRDPDSMCLRAAVAAGGVGQEGLGLQRKQHLHRREELKCVPGEVSPGPQVVVRNY